MAEVSFAALSHLHPADPKRVVAARARQLSVEDATRQAGPLDLPTDPVRLGSSTPSIPTRSCVWVTW
jgi:hypothetical protein